jgi:beta-lactamase regulating signal transducer with metallopeptidase domain
MPFAWPALEPPALAVVAYIVDSVWEGIAVAALAALVIRLFKRANATTRYAVWYFTLLAIVALPALTVGAMAFDPHRLARPQIVLPHVVILAGAALWGLGALAGLLRIAVGYAALAKLQRDALPLPPGYREAMPLWEDSIGHGRETRLCVSSNVAVPVAVGLFDGMILMPDHLLHSFDRADVDRFSVHEMAHLQRRDDWTCALERIACAVLFFNPAVRFVSRQLDLEREVACDDWVVAQTREVRPYAVGLTKMAEATKWPHRAVPTPAIFASRKSISIRIERLLNKHRDVRPTLLGAPALTCGAAILAASAVLLPMAPVIGNVSTPAIVVVGEAKPAAPVARIRAVRHAPPARTASTARPAQAQMRVVATVTTQAPVRAHVAETNTVVATVKNHVAAANTHVAPSSVRVFTADAGAANASRDLARLTVLVNAVSARARHAAQRSEQRELDRMARHLARVQLAQVPGIEPPAPAPIPAPHLIAVPRLVAQAIPVPVPQPRRADYLDALSAAGYDRLTADEIIALHDNGVSGSLLVASSRYFDHRLSTREIIALSASGVSSTYLDDLNRYGLRAGPKDVIAFTVNGVSASYAAMVLHAYPQLAPASVIQLMQNGVSSRVVTGLRERGYVPSLTEIVDLATHGVSLSYVDAINARRRSKMSLPQIVKLHDHGVSADAS